MPLTLLLVNYYSFMENGASKMWDSSDEEYETLAKKQDDMLGEMSKQELEHLIEHSVDKERYSYKLMLHERLNTRK